jgi:DNA polymerase III sliding clamp (beta) subunit (PCNA family)
MIKIAIADLKQFLSRSSGIKQKGVLPILAYIKLECKGNSATLTRSNLNAFVVHEFKVKCKKNITVLLDHTILAGVVDKTKSEEITIELEAKKPDTEFGGKVLYSDGEFKQRHELVDHANFPTVPENASQDKTIFNQAILESLHLSKNNTDPKQGNPFFQYVHINPNGKGSYIFGTNSTVIYYRHFDEKLPTISLDHDAVAAISKFQEVIYTENGNFDFFDTGNTLYGFIKPDFKASDISQIMKGGDDKMKFVIDKKQVLEYCQYVNRINPGLLAYVFFADAGKNSIMLRYSNDEYSLSADQFYDVEKKGTIRDFCFNPSQMVPLLKDLPYDKLNFNLCENHNCYITSEDDKDFIGVIREIVFQ